MTFGSGELFSGTLPASVPQGHAATPVLLTVSEVAEQLRACTATVYKLIDRGKLPAVRVAGSMLRVRAGDVARVMNPGS